MTREQVKFLNDIAAELKTQPGFNDVEQLFFPLRFDKNRPVAVQHKEIAEKLMPKDPLLGGVNYVTSIGTTVQNIVSGMVGRIEKKYISKDTKKETIKPAIKGLYEAEMRADGVDVDSLLNGKKGEKGTWEVVYDWLWNHKYLRWLEANSWKILQNKAKSDCPWIQFIPPQEIASKTRIPKRPSPPPSAQKSPSTIPVNEKLLMVVDLAYPNYQLLLFNRSAEGQYLLCPSLSFAPKGLIDKPPILLPQKDSWADENQEWFTFEVLGEEEFLAIALEKPLNLDWLVPRDEDPLPECTGSRFKELFDKLEQQENCHVFYQSFEVVE
jgi:hypothetical protein